jgi:hypothetical protein
VFEAFVLVCYLGQESDCRQLQDTRGPYATEMLCKQRIVEITVDLPKYLPSYQPKAYRCDKFTTTKDEPA